MKVLLDHPSPFLLAHGGFQIQIEQTKSALEAIGVDVEYLRWWDEKQRGDVIHYFGRPPAWQIEFARPKGIRVVMAELLTGQGSRSRAQLLRQRIFMRLLQRVAPVSFIERFNWSSYRLADACVALTPWEAHLMSYLFGAPRERVHVVPNGVEEVFLKSQPTPRGPWLICTATITERKRVVELAEAAVAARTPLRIVGRPYAESDAYAHRLSVLAQQHPQWIRYEGAIADRGNLARAYQEARGFVLLSSRESLSLSALEAAACGCPLLLSDLPWARTVFGEQASYCPLASVSRTASVLRRFYDAGQTVKSPFRPMTWIGVAEQLKKIYTAVLSTS